MVDRDYKKTSALSIKSRALKICIRIFSALLISNFLMSIAGKVWGGAREDEIAGTALREVRYISGHSRSLDMFGKGTVSQSAVVLDLSTAAQPALFKELRENKDWKVRYWVADILGYVGDAQALDPLFRVARRKGEKTETRLRALDSLGQIAKRQEGKKDEIAGRLKDYIRKAGNKKVRKKGEQVLKQI